jgi:hypothetical protein
MSGVTGFERNTAGSRQVFDDTPEQAHRSYFVK